MDYQEIKDAATSLHDLTLECRRHIHANPELSFQEHSTANYIASRLTEAGIPFRSIAGTGILARVEGQGDLMDCVVLRADMDALPVTEENDIEFASRNEGVMHACGHDIHTAALLGAMLLLNGRRSRFEGTVFGLFQPAEELAPGGASLVLDEDPFRDYRVKAFIGEHVATEFPAGELGFREGMYMASTDEIRITVSGQGGHAALADRFRNPVMAAAAIVTAMQEIPDMNPDKNIPTVLAVGRISAAGATNIIPAEVHLDGTLRTMDEKWRKTALGHIGRVAAEVAARHGADVLVDVAPGGYPCVVNDPCVTRTARRVAVEMWGADKVRDLDLRMTGEDFGRYTERYPSLFLRLGTARTDGKPTGGLHTSSFFPDENALDVGVATMSAMALEFLDSSCRE